MGILAKKTLFGLGIFVFLSLCCLSCSYRFTNLHSRAPKGVQNIAIEAVYDTSREVLPHDRLWESLQRAFAANGKLKVTSSDHSDAIVRAQITRASVTPYGDSTEFDKIEKDPKAFDSNQPPSIDSYKKLHIARSIKGKELLAMAVTVEIWNLNTKTLLFKRSYPVSKTYRAVSGTTTAENAFLRSEEDLASAFHGQSDSIAAKVVQDFLVSL